MIDDGRHINLLNDSSESLRTKSVFLALRCLVATVIGVLEVLLLTWRLILKASKSRRFASMGLAVSEKSSFLEAPQNLEAGTMVL